MNSKKKKKNRKNTNVVGQKRSWKKKSSEAFK